MEIDNRILGKRDYEELRRGFLEGIKDERTRELIAGLKPLRYYYPQLFPKIEGWGAKGQVKRRVLLIQAIEPLLPRLLQEGEEIRFVTRGIYSDFAEQFFMGWASLLINRTVFVFTNYRILMLNCDSKDRPLHMKWHVPYDKIRKFTSRSFLSSAMVFKLKDGKKLVFSHTPGHDRQPLRAFVEEMIRCCEQENFHLPSHQSRDNLCPNCFAPVPAKQFRCDRCKEEFIHYTKPALMSLCLPCLGDFYMGHFGIGTMELLGYGIAWAGFGMMLAEEGLSVLPIALPSIAVVHVIDALMTRHVALKGLVPLRCTWGRRLPEVHAGPSSAAP